MVSWHRLRWQQFPESRLLRTIIPRPLCSKHQDLVISRSWVRAATTNSDRSFTQNASRIRNIGIIAHIDAGKTTTTERMLYYSGYTRRLGDVDEGSTVTDFLPAEKARGITIQAAAITFNWPPSPDNVANETDVSNKNLSAKTHHINLIDTPGHADFTFEVRRSLRVLDGAICILDGVAGVEAQTEQVWKQAGEWLIPRIAYVNKLDRNGAAFGRTVKEIGVKLGGWPVVCQIPWWKDGRGAFCGIGDVVNLRAILYEEGGDGRTIESFELNELDQQQPTFAAELKRARIALVETLGDHDDELIEAFLDSGEDHLAIAPQQLWDSMRRCLSQKNSRIIPVFAGSSFRNIGVQPLLDAVNNLLPSPLERPDAEVSIGGKHFLLQEIMQDGQNFLKLSEPKKLQSLRKQTSSLTSVKGCALAFKVVNDPRRGPIVYFRVYSGVFERNDLIFNTNLQVTEKASTLLRMYASDSVPVESISAGEIGVIAGSKHARTGDTLISCTSSKASLSKPLATMQLKPIEIPPPVFFASLEPNSLREEKDMHEKLSLLLREDPSLHVSQDHDTGQTLISGMGELHLEIARDRLVGELKANARMGKIAIGYRETFTQPSALITRIFDKDKSDVRGRAGCTVRIEPIEHEYAGSPDDDNIFMHKQDGNRIIVRVSSMDLTHPDYGFSIPEHLNLRDIQQSSINGALAALSRGPAYSFPLHGVQVLITIQPSVHIFGSETTYSALTAAARLATVAASRDAAKNGASALMEPVMDVDVSVDESNLGAVVQDIASTRGGHVVSLGDETDNSHINTSRLVEIDPGKIYAPPDPFESKDSAGLGQQVHAPKTIKAKVPLKEMVGYLKHLRSMTGGRGTFVMSVDRFVKVSGQRERILIAEILGAI